MNPSNTATMMIGATGTSRCGLLETRVRGAWYRVTVTLESDFLSVSLDETCEPIDQTTTLNGTLGLVMKFLLLYVQFSKENLLSYTCSVGPKKE